MDIKKKEELLKANLKIFDELNDSDINYILGYVSGLANAKKNISKKVRKEWDEGIRIYFVI